MPLGILFYILILIWLLFGLYWNWSQGPDGRPNYGLVGGNLMLFMLFLILGWRVFGPPIQ